ncbi:hypothetical protein AZI86_04470 [Bdellovibrio bacteriovorus]|uniref:Uncharacterized protein n=1 Tax=Bdellovibrio bacteriovorus TaxID=959 RepID=A0A150WPM8_BDEBC|nr:hypothetical protein [Bdellovibrio bacteriovorus]KYG66316.1 hypothetical protein AZI86_04470 [Bdellovibrio bacteriovorus]
MKSLVTLIFTFLIAVTASAVTAPDAASCSQLKQELKAMQKAQQVMMTSLVNNHETFATALEEYAVKPAAKPMQKSAEAFRHRGLQGKKMAHQLNQATADLIARVSACL